MRNILTFEVCGIDGAQFLQTLNKTKQFIQNINQLSALNTEKTVKSTINNGKFKPFGASIVPFE